ncbi:uncharacterized protein TRAVEDRAFT_26773, partial [Trametes versicolor FP-101664 SS1]|uniref:uncharacterized protein n=1 Tax=Trametes versicolor (strain FP-101664) TaxID=717944 RepID=UPI0004621CA1
MHGRPSTRTRCVKGRDDVALGRTGVRVVHLRHGTSPHLGSRNLRRPSGSPGAVPGLHTYARSSQPRR